MWLLTFAVCPVQFLREIFRDQNFRHCSSLGNVKTENDLWLLSQLDLAFHWHLSVIQQK